jgi:hypothetical protein
MIAEMSLGRKVMKTRFLYLVALLTLIFGFIQISEAQNRQVLAKAESITGDRFVYAVRTAKGANVYGADRPSSAMLSAIDKGLADLFAVARKNRYSRRLNYSDYSVFIARADRLKDSQGRYSPDFAVGAAQYAGSVYDKGGYIYAAGMVIAYVPCAFVIADHTRDFQRVSDTVRYEGEHLILYHNDRRRYSETADHSKGGGHPILQ